LAWLRLGYSVAFSTLLSSSLILKLAVALYTLGYASGTVLLSPLSRVRASFGISVSLATPLATPRVQCCSLRSLEFEALFETRCRSLHPWLRLGYSVALFSLSSSSLVLRLAIARYTLGYASGTVLLSPFSRVRASFRGSVSPATPLAAPRVQCCSLSSLDSCSEARCRRPPGSASV